MNLLNETLEVLKNMDRKESDVLWVGSRDGKFSISWDKFKNIANVEYDNGYGGQEVATDLVVVGDYWWLERHEYDGSEWWEYKTLPSISAFSKEFNCVLGDTWQSLKDINIPVEEMN